VGGLAISPVQAVGKFCNSDDVLNCIVTFLLEGYVMYYQIKSNILYRNYGTFGYITDNRNYCYEKIGNYYPVIGDKIVSETGSIFLDALSQQPKEISELLPQIMQHITGVEYCVVYNDLIDFYNQLEKDGFIISGATAIECHQKDNKNYKYLNNCSDVPALEGHLDTQDFLKRYFDNKPVLRSLHIEITSVCNERCMHCYIPHENKNHHMDLDLFNKIVDESIKMKVLNFTLTGGEPMLHPNFLEMIKKCRKENISMNILSNLTVISKDIIAEFKGNPLISIQASLYSINPYIHDEITGVKGSCNLTKEAIRSLAENNVNLQISCPIIKQNFQCFSEVIEWAKTMNINVSSDYVIIGRYNSNTDNLNCRLDYKDVSSILKERASSNDVINIEKEIAEKKLLAKEDAICSVCRYSLCVSEKGNVYPCAGWQSFVLGDLNKSSLDSIWYESKKVNYLRDLRIKDFTDCCNCSYFNYCDVCMARNANENESQDPMKVSNYYCKIAKLRKDIFNNNKI
jgi:radical SAM protein with 4Fe4S-binding SPASM domain